jgi:hypothetical protein
VSVPCQYCTQLFRWPRLPRLPGPVCMCSVDAVREDAAVAVVAVVLVVVVVSKLGERGGAVVWSHELPGGHLVLVVRCLPCSLPCI